MSCMLALLGELLALSAINSVTENTIVSNFGNLEVIISAK